LRIAPNNPVFDLPVIVGIEERLFGRVSMSGSARPMRIARRTVSNDR